MTGWTTDSLARLRRRGVLLVPFVTRSVGDKVDAEDSKLDIIELRQSCLDTVHRQCRTSMDRRAPGESLTCCWKNEGVLAAWSRPQNAINRCRAMSRGGEERMISGMTALHRLDIHNQRIVQCRKISNFKSIAFRYNPSTWPHGRRMKNRPA